MHKYGLIGRSISYSFSPGYFKVKFEHLGLKDHEYEVYDMESILEFPKLLDSEPLLCGLNVTIPYKEDIIPYLDELNPIAKEIGAVNTICFRNGKLTGHNTDVVGFKKSILPLLLPTDRKALVLGTGGASKAILYVLKELGIVPTRVSRNSAPGILTYPEISASVISDHQIIINCTPLGTFPDVDKKPPLPYAAFSKDHLIYDLIYNPERTAFLKEGESLGARISNGYSMLVEQAEASWALWQSE